MIQKGYKSEKWNIHFHSLKLMAKIFNRVQKVNNSHLINSGKNSPKIEQIDLFQTVMICIDWSMKVATYISPLHFSCPQQSTTYTPVLTCK